MIETLANFSPAVIFIGAALCVPLVPRRIRNIFVILVPLFALFVLTHLSVGMVETMSFLDMQLTPVRVDKLSKAFGLIFCISATAAFIYGYYEKKAVEHTSALIYIGSALGVVFSGDLLTLYFFWEMMAVASTFLILASRTTASLAAAKRYILIHILGGVILLAGIVLQYQSTGMLQFNHFSEQTLATCLIAIGFLINAAALPFSSWLPDAYPEATVMGGVVLSAYTSKTAVYALLRGFTGWDILIGLGAAMALYGVIYALLENNIRRILAYSIVNQVGFMVCAAGIGTPLAIAGAVAHAFCHIIYKSILWMSAGAVLHRTGKAELTQLGGLYKAMPITLIFAVLGALSMTAPLTGGFISKSIILLAAEKQHLFWPWLILELGSVGVFITAGLKYIYFTFFAESKGVRTTEAPKTMLLGMLILSTVSIYLGCFPERLYTILPYAEIVKEKVSYSFHAVYIDHVAHVITKLQILLFSTLAFFIGLPLIKRSTKISVDLDVMYRKGATVFYIVIDWTLNTLNRVAGWFCVDWGVSKLAVFLKDAPANLVILCLKPVWLLTERSEDTQASLAKNLRETIALSTSPIGYSAVFSLVFLLALLYFS